MYNAKTMAKIEQKSNEIINRLREDLPKMDKEQAAREANEVLFMSELYWMRPTTKKGWMNWHMWLEQNAIFCIGYETQQFLWKYTKKSRKAKSAAKKYWAEVKANYENSVLQA